MVFSNYFTKTTETNSIRLCLLLNRALTRMGAKRLKIPNSVTFRKDTQCNPPHSKSVQAIVFSTFTRADVISFFPILFVLSFLFSLLSNPCLVLLGYLHTASRRRKKKHIKPSIPCARKQIEILSGHR